MAPKTSSASSGTRKKHARNAQATGVEPSSSQTQEKQHQEKPTALNPDPLDAVPGLAVCLTPPLLVVLRSLGKKAPVTKIRALEELHAGWVAHIDAEDRIALYALREMVPAWLHHLPAHVYPARRVRLLTALLAAALLRPGLTADAPDVVGSVWALAAHDAKRAVAAVASAPAARVQAEDKGPLAFLERVLLLPDGVYNELNPLAPVLLALAFNPHANFIFRRLQINWLISTVGGIGFKPLRVYPPFNWVYYSMTLNMPEIAEGY
ncbi:hypothetical protein B0H13DRAFT_2532397 [Mycena leptocephala]|nr:hypothetical protein B0H13DRAFT_2532397 [Mycena leptocephala]